MSVDTRSSRSHRWQQWVVLVGIVALAINLRPAAVSVGPVLAEITEALDMSSLGAGVLTALPVVSFATVGAATPRLAQMLGIHRLTLLAIVLVIAGILARSSSHGTVTFLIWTFIALSGMAAANVLLPSLIKLHFPHRIGPLTGVYTTALAIGLTAASVLTVPLARRHDTVDWRFGLAAWAVTAAVAMVPWLVLARRDRTLTRTVTPIRLIDVARTRLGILMAVFFGLQSLQAYSAFGWIAQIYRDAGFSADTAGLLLGIVTGVGIPVSLVVPVLAARTQSQAPLLIGLMACYPVALLGLMFVPTTLAWLWALVLGIGLCTFPLVLTLISLRARTSAGTAALSGFTQSAGYLIASLGPLGVGAIHQFTGGWTAPLGMLVVLAGLQLVAGLAVSRPDYIEDHLPPVVPSGAV